MRVRSGKQGQRTSSFFYRYIFSTLLSLVCVCVFESEDRVRVCEICGKPWHVVIKYFFFWTVFPFRLGHRRPNNRPRVVNIFPFFISAICRGESEVSLCDFVKPPKPNQLGNKASFGFLSFFSSSPEIDFLSRTSTKKEKKEHTKGRKERRKKNEKEKSNDPRKSSTGKKINHGIPNAMHFTKWLVFFLQRRGRI